MIDNNILHYSQLHRDNSVSNLILKSFEKIIQAEANKIKSQYPEIDMDDLVQEGKIRVYKLSQSYRPYGKTFGFIALVSKVLRSKLLRYTFNNFRTVRRPENVCVSSYVPPDASINLPDQARQFYSA